MRCLGSCLGTPNKCSRKTKIDRLKERLVNDNKKKFEEDWYHKKGRHNAGLEGLFTDGKLCT
ncbi:hypothetical protein SCLCIDRAFT_1222084, partial [Scleroderma citrinum Foug A]